MAVSKPSKEPYLPCLLVTEICSVCLIPRQELEDYFYYVQLCRQGIGTLETRQVSTHIPLEEIPSVMRAIGFYPSEEEVGQLFLLLLLKEERARLIALPKCSKGSFWPLPCWMALGYISWLSMYFYLVCINTVVVRIWQKIPKKVSLLASWATAEEGWANLEPDSSELFNKATSGSKLHSRENWFNKGAASSPLCGCFSKAVCPVYKPHL